MQKGRHLKINNITGLCKVCSSTEKSGTWDPFHYETTRRVLSISYSIKFKVTGTSNFTMKWVPEDDLEKKALQNYEVTFIGIRFMTPSIASSTSEEFRVH